MVPELMLLAYLPLAALTVVNLVYLIRRRRPPVAERTLPLVSVVIPARNEEHNLRRLIPTLSAQRDVDFEVLIYDDASEDGTARVTHEAGDPRIRLLRGEGPPPGWVGKVHALYSATREARGEILLFLDADTALRHERALHDLVTRFLALPTPRVMSGLTHLRGGGTLLVSMVAFALLATFPIPLAPRGRTRSLGVVNGQCWMIERTTYLEHEPHLAQRAEVVEDVMIGRYLKTRGAAPHVLDLQPQIDVWMYEGFREAWLGFRKNASLVAGGFAATWIVVLVFTVLFIVGPILSPWNLAAVYLLKLLTDRFSGFPLVVTLLAPLSYLLTVLLNIDSAIGHARGTVSWKGRRVGPA